MGVFFSYVVLESGAVGLESCTSPVGMGLRGVAIGSTSRDVPPLHLPMILFIVYCFLFTPLTICGSNLDLSQQAARSVSRFPHIYIASRKKLISTPS